MKHFYRKTTREVYEEYVKNCKNSGGIPLGKIAFSKRFLKENPQYFIKVAKIDGKSVRCFFNKEMQKEEDNKKVVSNFLWDTEL